MIYIFMWNSEFLVKDATMKWKNQFISKYGDFNLVHIKEPENMTKSSLALNMFSASFLWEKKLIIIDLENNILEEDLTEFFLNSFDKIPENNIVLFSFPNPDKRTKFYKELEKAGEVKRFDIDDNNKFFTLINSRYNWKISINAISLLLRYKANNLNKTIQEIEKLSILYPFIDEKEVKENIVPELEESIFQVIDDILNLRIIDAINKINILNNDTNIYVTYNSLLSNLRVNLFITKLKKDWIPSNEIAKVLDLWNRAFIVNKNYKISSQKLQDLFVRLVNIDKKMKTWNMIWTEDTDFLLEVEKVLLVVWG